VVRSSPRTARENESDKALGMTVAFVAFKMAKRRQSTWMTRVLKGLVERLQTGKDRCKEGIWDVTVVGSQTVHDGWC